MSSRKVVQYGLTEVCSSPDPAVDIVLVHGLNGHPYNTWATHKPDIFWPTDLLPQTLDEQRVRILTYGYDANVTAFTDGTSKDKIHNHAEHLAGRLVANRSLKKASERPIIFICHSLGGLVVKRCLIYCKSVRHSHLERLRSIYVSTYGILFLGTPHNGSDIARWGTLLHSICSAMLPKKFFDSSPQLVEALKTNNETLQNINRLFVDIIGRFQIYFFHESKPMDLKGTRQLVVEEDSAAPVIEGVERMGIEKDHSNMCKFEDESSPGFDVVAEALMRYSEASPSIIQRRWVEEKQVRDLERQAAAREILGDSLPAANPNTSSADVGQSGLLGMTGSTGITVRPMLELGPEMPVQSSGVLLVTPTAFRFNLTFFGFQIELDQLSKKLHGSRNRDFGLCAVLVHGGPGSGKSHLVREFVWRNREKHLGGVFWVDARSDELLYQCFWEIAQAASLATDGSFSHLDAVEQFVPAVKAWLEDRDDWLLVFDNLNVNTEEELQKFAAFIPYRKTGKIIYTSANRTLARKSKLFHPSDVKVHPLSPEDARLLLYDGLGIHHPTPQQEKKATEVVRHLECLPLAIYALSHRLFATGKTLEKYQMGSYKTDSRLAEPYVEIMFSLWENSHIEAINLINILSMLGHVIPVAMVQLGHKALADFNIEIRSADREGITKKDLDTTIATLIRYGLVERALQPYTNLEHSFSTASRERLKLVEGKADQQSVNSEDSPPASTMDASSSQESIGGIDILQVHAVVQGFCRDELWSRERDKYWWYLTAAVGLFCMSYRRAAAIIAREPEGGLVRDFREFDYHAAKLHSHFPKSQEKASELLRSSRHELRDVLRSIKKEIQERSPQQSFESVRHVAQASIFDRTSSTSSQGPETPISTPSRTSTWTFEETAKEESPTEYRGHEIFQNEVAYRTNIGDSLAEDGGYVSETDYETDVPRRRSTGNNSEKTISPRSPAQSKDKVTAGSRFSIQQMFKRHFSGRKVHKNLGDWRPIPSKPKITYSEANVVPALSESFRWAPNSSSSENSRPTSATSEATAHLIAVRQSSSPARNDVRVRSASRAGHEEQYPPLTSIDQAFKEKPNESALSPLATEFKPRASQQQKVDDGASAVNSLYDDSRRASAPSIPPQVGFIQPLPELPIENDISVTHPTIGIAVTTNQSALPVNYVPANQLSLPLGYATTNQPALPLIATTNQPSFPAPYATADQPPLSITYAVPNQSSLPLNYATGSTIIPTGYSSQPMSRDGSKESSTSMLTEPPRFKPSFSQSPNSRFSTMSAQTSPQPPGPLLASIPIDGGLARRHGSASPSPVSPILAHSSSGSDVLTPVIIGPQYTNSVQFGASEPVDIAEAHRRTEEYRRRLPFERGEFRLKAHQQRPYPSRNMIPTPSDEGILSNMVEPIDGRGSRLDSSYTRGLGIRETRKASR